MSADVLQLRIPQRPDGPTYYHNHGVYSPPPGSHLYSSSHSPTPYARQPAASNSRADQSSTISPDTTVETSSIRDSEHEDLERIRADQRDEEDDGLDLARYNSLSQGRSLRGDDYDTPLPSPAWHEAGGDEPSESVATDTTISDSPLATPTIADDTSIKHPPSRQVDFLSHEWREEDIWSSWRHIVSQRKTYGEKSRLENASWRTWAKTKYRLPTVSPEKLNWLKESDVTWLYGPLQTARSYPITHECSIPSSRLSKNNSFINKKPILKKRSMSEIMLQKSISTSSLLKQAAASVQAQGGIDRRSAQMSDLFDSKISSTASSRDQFDYFASRSTSTISTPGGEPQERRHIRFDDRVEQCIAVEAKSIVDEEGKEVDCDEDAVRGSSDSDSDDGVMMRSGSGRTTPKSSRSNSLSGMKTIETLPSTTLKYRMDSPDITAEAQYHTFGRPGGLRLGQSPSQETLRPAHPSSNFLIPEDDEDADADAESSSWSFGSSNPRSSLGAAAGRGRSRHDDGGYEVEGMRRTGSGMFMPYDDDEDEAASHGLFGRVSETINTARDIAHVIWNVGWRK